MAAVTPMNRRAAGVMPEPDKFYAILLPIRVRVLKAALEVVTAGSIPELLCHIRCTTECSRYHLGPQRCRQSPMLRCFTGFVNIMGHVSRTGENVVRIEAEAL